MNRWPLVAVEDLAATTDNALATGPFGSSIGTDTFRPVGVPVIRGSNLSADVECRLDDASFVFIEEDLAQKFRRSQVGPGDLVFTCWGTINQIGLIDSRSRYPRYVISNKQMKLTPDPEKADSLFLYYWFSGPQAQRQILSSGIGSSVPGFNLGQLRRMKVPLPALAEQRAVAKRLGTLDDMIELNQGTNRILEELVRRTFQSWFLDFEPVRAKVAGASNFRGMPQKAFGRLPTALAESSLGRVPVGWQVAPLSKIVELLGGGTPKRKVPDYWDGEIPWFSVRDAPAEGAIWVIDTAEHITQAGADNSSAKVVRPGTTIISARGTVGRLALTGVPMALNQSCYGIQGADGAGDYFTYFTLYHAVEELKRRTHGCVFDTITRQTFDSLLRIRPQQEALDAFEGAVAPYMELIRHNLFENRTLALIRNALLPRLISGKLMANGPEEADHG